MNYGKKLHRLLKNEIEHVYGTCEGTEIGLFDLPPEVRMVEWRNEHCNDKQSGLEAGTSPQSVSGGVNTAEQLRSVLEDCGWNRSEAARHLGVDRSTVWRKMKQWELQPTNR